MEEKCAVCNSTIPEGGQVCPICKSGYTTIAPMIWEAVAFCHWRAVGKQGEFSVWKNKKRWKGKYRSADGSLTRFYGEQRTLKAIKKTCEDSEYWEK